MNVNALPFIGWAISAIVNVSMAIPFYIGWNLMGIGIFYFDFLPEKWQTIGFWDTVWLFLCLGIIKSVCFPIVSASSTSEVKR